LKAYIFPGQGSQFPGMGKNLFEHSKDIQTKFNIANELLGFDITEVMFNGTAEDLKQTKVTQPAIFLHSTLMAEYLKADIQPAMVAGHSLGEFSALVVNKTLQFEDALKLVAARANAMQKACEIQDSTMAAILALENEVVEKICEETDGVVVAANYNCPGQLVISGEVDAINKACEALKEAGARRALVLPVGGAFHSPLMEPAKNELQAAIEATQFNTPICPIYQNVTASASVDPNEIKANLITQLTAPVKWMQSIEQMAKDGATEFYEVGPGKVLTGLMRKINRELQASKLEIEAA